MVRSEGRVQTSLRWGDWGVQWWARAIPVLGKELDWPLPWYWPLTPSGESLFQVTDFCSRIAHAQKFLGNRTLQSKEVFHQTGSVMDIQAQHVVQMPLKIEAVYHWPVTNCKQNHLFLQLTCMNGNWPALNLKAHHLRNSFSGKTITHSWLLIWIS